MCLKSYVPPRECCPIPKTPFPPQRLAVQHAPQNPDYSLHAARLVLEKRRSSTKRRSWLMRAGTRGRIPAYTDVYFSLGTLYADHLKDPSKSVDGLRALY